MLKSNSFQIPGKQGFSMIELLIVVVIIGVIALFSVPNIKGTLRSVRIKNFCRTLSATVRLARKTAILESKNVDFCIDFDNELIWLEFTGGNEIKNTRQKAPESVDLTSADIYGEADVISTGIAKITFYPSGTAGVFYQLIRLTYYPFTKADESVANADEFYTLSIDQSTGRPRIISFGWMQKFI